MIWYCRSPTRRPEKASPRPRSGDRLRDARIDRLCDLLNLLCATFTTMSPAPSRGLRTSHSRGLLGVSQLPRTIQRHHVPPWSDARILHNADHRPQRPMTDRAEFADPTQRVFRGNDLSGELGARLRSRGLPPRTTRFPTATFAHNARSCLTINLASGRDQSRAHRHADESAVEPD
jgi:hypothetical protein